MYRRRPMAIHLGRASPRASRDQPGRRGPETGLVEPRAAPTRSCSWRGLPCRLRCRSRGALLPHPFTLAAGAAAGGGLLSVALSLGSPPPGVTRRHVSVEPGLSSLSETERAAIRPPDSRFKEIARRQRTVNVPRQSAPRDGPRSRHPPRHPPAPGENGAERR